jgi:3',5'-cyclic AMP phosphodiesterase CpdA
MPGLFYEPIDRKTFLGAATRVATAGVLTQIADSSLAADASATEAHIALLSDTHIPADSNNEYRSFRPVDNLRRIVPQVAAARPEAVIVNGDAARLRGLPEDYTSLKELLAPIAAQVPIYIGLGNHDDRRNFFDVFSEAGKENASVGGKHVTVLESGPLRFIVLDSLLYVDKVAGLLGKAQRAWLAKFLENSDDRPHVLIVHHTLGDGDGDLLDVDRLFTIISQHRKVKAVFYGHSHRYAQDRRGHIQLINLPAVGYNFHDSQPVGWVDARFSREGVSMILHAIGGNRDGDGKTTSIAWE